MPARLEIYMTIRIKKNNSFHFLAKIVFSTQPPHLRQIHIRWNYDQEHHIKCHMQLLARIKREIHPHAKFNAWSTLKCYNPRSDERFIIAWILDIITHRIIKRPAFVHVYYRRIFFVLFFFSNVLFEILF